MIRKLLLWLGRGVPREWYEWATDDIKVASDGADKYPTRWYAAVDEIDKAEDIIWKLRDELADMRVLVDREAYTKMRADQGKETEWPADIDPKLLTLPEGHSGPAL